MATGGGKKKKKKPGLTDREWELIKAEYVGGPAGTSFRSLARPGASHQTIARRALVEKWEEERARVNGNEIQQAIHKLADQRSAESANVPAIAGEVLEGLTLGEAAAIEARASVLDRHRKEWGAVRARIYQGLQQNKFDKLKEAKISAEALSIVQAGERKAWGLDKPLAMTFTFVNESGRDVYD